MNAFQSVSIPWMLCLGLLSLATGELRAATRTKANNADNLNLASSWTNGVVPGSADVALVDSTVTGPLSANLGASVSWNQINFANPGGDFIIAAGSQLTLSNNTPIIFGAGAANLTLDCDLFCAGAAFSTLPSAPVGRTITYGGVIQGRDTTVTLGNSAGTLRLGNAGTVRIGTIVQASLSATKIGIGASSVGSPIVSGPLGTNQFNTSAGTELFAYNGPQTLANPLRIQGIPLIFSGTDNLTFGGLVDLNNQPHPCREQ